MMGVLVVVLAAVVASCGGCDIEQVRFAHAASLSGQTPDQWSRADTRSADIQTLMHLAEGDTNQGVTKALYVSESYSQVADGTYCIRFSASGSCSTAHCESLECVAGGYKSPGSTSQMTISSVQCQHRSACNITEIRENARKALRGGWRVEPIDSDIVVQLFDRASKIANVKRWNAVDAYIQAQEGINYCMSFQSEGLNGCGFRDCQRSMCVASGHLPLLFAVDPTQTTSVHDQSLQQIGVSCEPEAAVPGCNHRSCDYYDKELCGGPTRGRCTCGECTCNEGFVGQSCSCATSTASCMAKNGLICNGVGECVRGACECSQESNFGGPTCEDCPTCLPKSHQNVSSDGGSVNVDNVGASSKGKGTFLASLLTFVLVVVFFA